MANDALASPRGFKIRNRDGLDLYVGHWPAPRLPGVRRVLCLPGLTRNGRDFLDVATALNAGPNGREVFTLDARGRGLSDWDRNSQNYNVPTEAQDTIDAMIALDLHDAALIGTSRGGLVTMAMAAIQPGLIGAAVLNDIGPVIEAKGLTRIGAYVGRMPVPVSWDDAAKTAADISRKAFPAVPDEAWAKVARAWFNDRNGKPAPGYDPALAKSFGRAGTALPTLWPQFEALKRASVLVIRGQNSDLLSAATVAEMQSRHSNCAQLTVPGEGHAPLLMDKASIDVIRSFLHDADVGTPVGGRNYAAPVAR